MALKSCKECNEQISKKAAKCPKCGSPQKSKPIGLFPALIIIFVLVYFIGDMVESDRTKEIAQQKATTKARNDQVSKADFQKRSDEIISEAESLFSSKKHSQLKNLSDKYKPANNARMKELGLLAEEQIILKQLIKIPSTSYQKNLDKYKRLSAIDPSKRRYRDRIKHYNKKIAREKLISKGFSSWNGSHITLENYIEKRMKDPSSYDHVSTRYVDKGEYLIITTTYRGKNSFGGIVVNSARAKARIDGALIEIL